MKAEKMFDMTRELSTLLGMEPSRLRLEWISSSEGTRFAEVAREFTEQLRTLGPSSFRAAA